MKAMNMNQKLGGLCNISVTLWLAIVLAIAGFAYLGLSAMTSSSSAAKNLTVALSSDRSPAPACNLNTGPCFSHPIKELSPSQARNILRLGEFSQYCLGEPFFTGPEGSPPPGYPPCPTPKFARGTCAVENYAGNCVIPLKHLPQVITTKPQRFAASGKTAVEGPCFGPVDFAGGNLTILRKRLPPCPTPKFAPGTCQVESTSGTCLVPVTPPPASCPSTQDTSDPAGTPCQFGSTAGCSKPPAGPSQPSPGCSNPQYFR